MYVPRKDNKNMTIKEMKLPLFIQSIKLEDEIIINSRLIEDQDRREQKRDDLIELDSELLLTENYQ